MPNVRIRVLRIFGGRVRIGIEAPKEVVVHREEVFERIKRESQGTAPPHTEPDDLDPRAEQTT
jgi:carbon storage regulator